MEKRENLEDDPKQNPKVTQLISNLYNLIPMDTLPKKKASMR